METFDKNNSEISTEAFAGEGSSDPTSKDSHHRDSSDEIQESSGTRSIVPTIPRKLSVQAVAQPKSVITAPKRASFFKPASPMKAWLWKSYKGLLYGSSSKDIPSSKLALFDMDGTLIVNKLGRRVSDWEFFDSSVPQKLKALSAEGFRIFIISNQLGVSLGMLTAESLQKKIEEFVGAANIECTALLAIRKDNFRKPETGCWDFIRNTLNSSVSVDANQCVVKELT
jgi:DNA 3'-phosphatase